MDNLSTQAQSLVQAMRQLGRAGHTHVPQQALWAAIAKRNTHLTREQFRQALTEAVAAGKLIQTQVADATVIYVPAVYQMEKSVAQRLTHMASKQLPPMSPSKLQATLKRARHTSALSAEQFQAVMGTITNKITVLTGGPGTGKTTTLRTILDVADAMHISYQLAAPTGQAAKRMTRSTGRAAATVHRLLGYNPEEDAFTYDKDHLLPTDMVVIDEASMLDLWLIHHLLRALHKDTRILFVGDIHQLPSVGAGNVLKDIIASGIACVSHLTTIFRQSAESHIVVHAQSVNAGEMPVLDNHSQDFFMFRVPDEQITAMVTDIVAHRIPQRFGYAVADIQVLAAKYKGVGGVDEINAQLQQQLTNASWSVRLKHGTFKVGDRVVQTKNNYQDGVMNGEVGQITFINKQEQSIRIDFEGNWVTYGFNQMWLVKLAYAITTHRSQGAEFPVVVIPIACDQGAMLQRNLLYTAITRARKMVVLVGSDAAVQQAIQNAVADARWTALAHRMCQ